MKTKSIVPFRPDTLIPEGRHGRALIRHVAVVDPHPHPDAPLRPIIAARNLAGDILATELAHGRITRAAYNIGREIEEALAIVGGSGQPQWLQGDRVDAGRRVELAVVAGLDRAAQANRVIRRTYRSVGMIMGRVIELVLRNRLTWGQVARNMGYDDSERDRRYVARQFRDGLEHLTGPANQRK